WGSTAGQLEGPYDSVEVATREFQDIYQAKIGIEWTQRETIATSGGAWTNVEFEYDVVTIEDEVSAKPTRPRSQSQPFIDTVNPIAKQLTIYQDSETYQTILTQKSTGIMYITQLLYNVETKTYYVYLRWGDSDYILDGPYDSVDVAKEQYKTKFIQTFGVSWEERQK
ncbi:hypothetical protein BGX34_008624, partial [Mortierella sp. NVP85]